MEQQTLVSSHFIINYWEDTQVINEILETLENNYTRIVSILQVELADKCVLYIYPSIDMFHQAIDETDAEDWLAGRFDNGTIKMVSPNNPGSEHDYDSVMAIAVHELVHLVAEHVNNCAPDYIAEGLATYLAGQDENVKEFIQDDLINGNFPSMTQLKSMKEEVYHYGYAFIKYVMSEYGVDGVLKLYKSVDVNTALNIDENEFHKNWKAYLTETCLAGIDK